MSAKVGWAARNDLKITFSLVLWIPHGHLHNCTPAADGDPSGAPQQSDMFRPSTPITAAQTVQAWSKQTVMDREYPERRRRLSTGEIGKEAGGQGRD